MEVEKSTWKTIEQLTNYLRRRNETINTKEIEIYMITSVANRRTQYLNQIENIWQEKIK